jgi:RND family efflux transporter MFP subunit
VLVAQQDVDDKNGKDKVSQADFDTAQAALASAGAQLDVAKANQDRVHALFDYSRVTAPFAGVVTKRYADIGTMIQQGTASTTQALPVVRIAEDDVLRLVIPVPESAVPAIHPGADVDVTVPVLSRTFTGKVARDASQLDLSTRTMHTEVDVTNPARLLVPGMYAEATIVLSHLDRVLTVPLTALDRTEQGASVLRVGSGNVLERRAVTLGIETTDTAEIVSGLAEGDLVVTGSRSLLQPGVAVAPKVVAPLTGPGGGL